MTTSDDQIASQLFCTSRQHAAIRERDDLPSAVDLQREPLQLSTPLSQAFDAAPSVTRKVQPMATATTLRLTSLRVQPRMEPDRVASDLHQIQSRVTERENAKVAELPPNSIGNVDHVSFIRARARANAERWAPKAALSSLDAMNERLHFKHERLRMQNVRQRAQLQPEVTSAEDVECHATESICPEDTQSLHSSQKGEEGLKSCVYRPDSGAYQRGDSRGHLEIQLQELSRRWVCAEAAFRDEMVAEHDARRNEVAKLRAVAETANGSKDMAALDQRLGELLADKDVMRGELSRAMQQWETSVADLESQVQESHAASARAAAALREQVAADHHSILSSVASIAHRELVELREQVSTDRNIYLDELSEERGSLEKAPAVADDSAAVVSEHLQARCRTCDGKLGNCLTHLATFAKQLEGLARLVEIVGSAAESPVWNNEKVSAEVRMLQKQVHQLTEDMAAEMFEQSSAITHAQSMAKVSPTKIECDLERFSERIKGLSQNVLQGERMSAEGQILQAGLQKLSEDIVAESAERSKAFAVMHSEAHAASTNIDRFGSALSQLEERIIDFSQSGGQALDGCNSVSPIDVRSAMVPAERSTELVEQLQIGVQTCDDKLGNCIRGLETLANQLQDLDLRLQSGGVFAEPRSGVGPLRDSSFDVAEETKLPRHEAWNELARVIGSVQKGLDKTVLRVDDLEGSFQVCTERIELQTQSVESKIVQLEDKTVKLIEELDIQLMFRVMEELRDMCDANSRTLNHLEGRLSDLGASDNGIESATIMQAPSMESNIVQLEEKTVKLEEELDVQLSLGIMEELRNKCDTNSRGLSHLDCLMRNSGASDGGAESKIVTADGLSAVDILRRDMDEERSEFQLVVDNAERQAESVAFDIAQLKAHLQMSLDQHQECVENMTRLQCRVDKLGKAVDSMSDKVVLHEFVAKSTRDTESAC